MKTLPHVPPRHGRAASKSAKVRGPGDGTKNASPPSMSTQRLHYYVRNGGGGSAGVVFCSSTAAAMEAEDKITEQGGEGWGEPYASSVDLRVRDGQIEYRFRGYVDGKYVERWLPAEVKS